MRTYKAVLIAAVVALLTISSARAQVLDISHVPKSIQKFSLNIQGKNPSEVRAAIIKRFGPAQRDTGSGLRIEEWDISGGVLIFHPLAGPAFVDPKTKTAVGLLKTHNPVWSNILGSYEMTTLPNPANHGTRLWLGNVELDMTMTYKFTESGLLSGQADQRLNNYFMQNPTGTVEIRFIDPIKPDLFLESLTDGITVASLVFTSSDKKHEALFSITNSTKLRMLVFNASEPLPFALGKSWNSFWQ